MPLVRIEVEDGLSFYAEVDEKDEVPAATSQNHYNLPPGATPTGIADDVQKSAEVAKETVRAAVAYIRNSFSDFNQPDELQLEFSLALKGSGGIPVLAQQSVEAAFKITAKWTRPEQDTSK